MYNDVARLSSSRAFVTNVLETVNDVRVVNTEYPIVVRVIGIMLKNLIQHYIDAIVSFMEHLYIITSYFFKISIN